MLVVLLVLLFGPAAEGAGTGVGRGLRCCGAQQYTVGNRPPAGRLQEIPFSCRTCTILYVWRLGVRFLLQLRASAGACECRTRCGPAEFTHGGASYATARSSAPFRYCFMEVGPVAGCCCHARRVSVCDRQQIKTAKAKRALRAGMGTANNANPVFKQQICATGKDNLYRSTPRQASLRC